MPRLKLYPGEEILWRGRPHRWFYILRPLFSLPLTLLLSGLILWVCVEALRFSLERNDEIFFGLSTVVFFLVFLAAIAPLFDVALNWFRYSSSCYTVTNARIIVRDDLWSRAGFSVKYADIVHISIHRSFLEGLFGLGTIEILVSARLGDLQVSGYDKNVVPMRFLGRPSRVYRILRDLVPDLVER